MSLFNSMFRKKQDTDSGFLSSLSERERLSVANLSPMAYQAIAMEKEGREITLQGLDPGVLEFLRRLSVDELNNLEKSVKALIKADGLSEADMMAEAAEAYREAFECNPYNDIAIMSYGCALANRGDVREGIRWVEKALAVNPDNDRARRNLEGMKDLMDGGAGAKA